jgi:hypothetical protein
MVEVADGVVMSLVACYSASFDTGYARNDTTVGISDITFLSAAQGQTTSVNYTSITYSGQASGNFTSLAGSVTVTVSRTLSTVSTGFTTWGPTGKTLYVTFSATTASQGAGSFASGTTSTTGSTTGAWFTETYQDVSATRTTSSAFASSFTITRTAFTFNWTTDTFDDESGHTITYPIKSVASTVTTTGTSASTASRSYKTLSTVTKPSTAVQLFAGTDTIGNGFLMYNTIYRFLGAGGFAVPIDLSPEVAWLPTATGSETGRLEDLAMSFTNDFTLMASDYLTLSTGTYLTSTAGHAISSFSTSINSSTFAFLGFVVGAATFTPPTYEQFYLGNVTAPAGQSVGFSHPTSSTVFNSFSFSTQFRSVATFSTTLSGATTVVSTAGTTFTENAQANDNQALFGEASPINPRALRSTTIVTSVTTTVSMVSCSEGIPEFQQVQTDVGILAISVGRTFSRWRPNVPLLAAINGGRVVTGWSPVGGTGFGLMGTAGQPPVIYGAMHASVPSAVAGYTFALPWINPFNGSVVAKSQMSIPWLYPDTFTIAAYQTGSYSGTYEDEDEEGTFTSSYSGVSATPFSATGQFDSGDGVAGSLSVTVADSVSSSSGVLTINLVSGSVFDDISGHSAVGGTFLGGRQSVAGPLTYGAGVEKGVCRNITSIDATGGRTTGSLFATDARPSTTVPTSVLVFESYKYLYSARQFTSSGQQTGLGLAFSPLAFAKFMRFGFSFENYATTNAFLPTPPSP